MTGRPALLVLGSETDQLQLYLAVFDNKLNSSFATKLVTRDLNVALTWPNFLVSPLPIPVNE